MVTPRLVTSSQRRMPSIRRPIGESIGRKPMARRRLGRNLGLLTRKNVSWKAASVTIPMSRVELVVNGEIRESQAIPADAGSGHWTIRLDKTAWLALLVRGHYADKPEIIAAHSTPVMVEVDGKPPLAAADAVSMSRRLHLPCLSPLNYPQSSTLRRPRKAKPTVRDLLT